MKIIFFVAGVLAFVSFVRGAFTSGLHNNTTIFVGGIAILLWVYGYFFDRLKKIKWLTGTIVAGICAVLGFSVFLFAYGRRSTTTFDEDVVVVLGAGIRDGEVRDMLAMRLDMAVAYHQQNPTALIIVSGGLGHREEITEAQAMADYLVARGVDRERIRLEGMAYSTYANMRYSREIIYYYFETPPRVAVITSNFHIFRSVRFARQVGLYGVTVYPSGTPWAGAPFAYVREVASVIKMWVVGT